MKVSITSVAESEITEAITYYETCSPGLGAEFLFELEQALQRIEHHPNAWHLIGPNTRRCLLRRFPYGAIYSETGHDSLLMTGLMALRMDPLRWQERIE